MRVRTDVAHHIVGYHFAEVTLRWNNSDRNSVLSEGLCFKHLKNFK